VGLNGRSEKGGTFKSQVTIYPYLKLTPDDAHVSPSLSFPSGLTACRADRAGAQADLVHSSLD
jgi:hypothetical protein